MTKVQAVVEFNCIGMDAPTARAHAKQLVEGRGLIVASTKIVKDNERGKDFVPKAGKPGSIVVRMGRRFEVWSDGHGTNEIWVVPVDRLPGDAAVYRTYKGEGTPLNACHGDGSHCAGPGGLDGVWKQSNLPCRHKSHSAAA